MALTKVITDLTEFNPGNPEYVLNATNPVTVINAGGNQYNFNGVYGKFGLRIGTTVLTGVPSSHPFAVLNNGLTGITYTGTVNEGTLAVGGFTYTFYSGDVTITVTAGFGVASYYCKIHGYMGGENNFVSVYSTSGLRMPSSSSAYSGPAVAKGMMRNEVGQVSESSASCMQHYNGTDWKNFDNLSNSTLGTCNYPVTGTALYQFEDNANDTCGTYNGTAGANITYPAGKFGKAANFPGNLNTPADGIVLPSSLSPKLINNFSMSFWFNADTFATGCLSGCGNYPTLFAGFEDMKMYFCVYGSGSNYKLYYYNYGGSGANLIGTTNLSTSTWYNAVLTQSSTGGAKIYLDGNIDGSNASITADGPSTGTASGQNLFGGYNSSGNFDLPWNGLMDQIRIFPSVLTQGDIDKLQLES